MHSVSAMPLNCRYLKSVWLKCQLKPELPKARFNQLFCSPPLCNVGYPRHAFLSPRNSSMDVSDIHKMSLCYACSPKLPARSQDWLVFTTDWRFQTNGFRPWHETCTQFLLSDFFFSVLNLFMFSNHFRLLDLNCWLTRNPYTKKTTIILWTWIHVGIDS
jgi:hypothetical protein